MYRRDILVGVTTVFLAASILPVGYAKAESASVAEERAAAAREQAEIAREQALKSGKPVQEISVADLQEKLKSQGAVFDWRPPLAGPAFFRKLFQLYDANAGTRALTPGQ